MCCRWRRPRTPFRHIRARRAQARRGDDVASLDHRAGQESGSNASPRPGLIHGRGTSRVGSGAGSLIVIDDGMTAPEVWPPAGTSPWDPVHRTQFELEVTIGGPVGASPDLDSPHAESTRHALAGDLESARGAALAFLDELDRHRAAAVATDLRPLD